ncbi:hypothetical protein CHARACLAT_021089 [Characodon lateralis]|uniref:Uncharacterized protein n=1 Tax=Characodon lateralis TaxID=208331 RepID=A0ABU7DWY6_9TELE|nr:hypothetical protein [Characodon lateralis]
MNLPQPRDLHGSTGSDCRIAPCSKRPACAPSNTLSNWRSTLAQHTGLLISVSVFCSLLPRTEIPITNELIPEA